MLLHPNHLKKYKNYNSTIRLGPNKSASAKFHQKMKPAYHSLWQLLILAILPSFLFAQQLPAPQLLRCDLLLHTDRVYQAGEVQNIPLVKAVQQPDKYQFAHVSSTQPQFQWAVDTAIRRVSAYRILLASSPQLLQQNRADYWDSGKFKSNQTRSTYRGKALSVGKVHYWKVQVWDQQNRATAFSAPMAFYYSSPSTEEPFAYHPLTAALQKPANVVKGGEGSYFLDFGKAAFSQVQLNLTSEKTDTAWIECGELLEAPQVIHRNPGRNIRYLKLPLLVKKGTFKYTLQWPENPKRDSRNPIQMPNYMGEVYPFRYLSIKNFAGQLQPESIQRKIVFYPFDEAAATFHSSDTILNQVWDLCKYSIKATSFMGYYVDGDRERIPYEADALINQLSHYAVDAEYSMARRSLNYLLYHPTWPTEWSLQNALIAWNDYLYTGDPVVIQKYYDELQRKSIQALAGPSGLVSTRTNLQSDAFLQSIHITKPFDGRRGLHDIVDWPQNGNFIGSEKSHAGETDGFVFNTYNAVINAYYYRNLVLLEKMARLLQKKEDAASYRSKAAIVYRAYQNTFRDAATGLIKDGDSTIHSSLHANMFALAFGLVPAADQDKVLRFMQSRGMACSVYGSQFLMDALYKGGYADYALDLLSATTQRSWYNMIRSGSTIAMEAWDMVYKPNLDLNHAWGAVPANTMVRKLMGVEPLSPGFDTFQIKPQVGDLEFATLKTPSLKGTIIVTYQKSSSQHSLEVVIPGGTSVHLYMPVGTGKNELWVDGQKKTIKSEAGYWLLRDLNPGRHLILSY